MDNSILNDLNKAKKIAEAQLKRAMSQHGDELEKIEEGLSKKICEAVKNGDKSIIDDIHKKVEAYKNKENGGRSNSNRQKSI